MDELDSLRSFRSGVAAPSTGALARALAYEPRSQRRTLPYRRLALVASTAVVVAAVALGLAQPWSGGPGILDRAAAALVPGSTTVLHERVQMTATDVATGKVLSAHTLELWLEGAAPHRYRAFFTPPFTNRMLEVGGSAESIHAAVYRPATNTFDTHSLQLEIRGATELDVVRAALANGSAVEQGSELRDGRNVLRILLPASGPKQTDQVYFVDPQTYAPVEIDGQGFLVDAGKRYHVTTVQRFLTFDLLPATPANLRLTDIRAMHPDANG